MRTMKGHINLDKVQNTFSLRYGFAVGHTARYIAVAYINNYNDEMIMLLNLMCDQIRDDQSSTVLLQQIKFMLETNK